MVPQRVQQNFIGGVGIEILEEEHIGDEWYKITLIDNKGDIYECTRDPQGNMSEPEIIEGDAK